MGNYNHGAAVASVGLQVLEDQGAIGGVEVSGGFVGEHHTGFLDQGPGQRGSLPFAGTECRRAVVLPRGEAQFLEQT